MSQRPERPRKAGKQREPVCVCRATTLSELARNLAVSDRTLRRLQAEGTIEPVKAAAGRRAAEYDPWTVVRAVLGRQGNAREAKDEATAEWMRLKIEEKRREVLPRGEVVRAGRAIVATVTARLLRLPADLVRLAGLPAKKEAEADRAIREALEELARFERAEDLAS